MTGDTRLISIKDGGRFAMSWIAGTNPKALRSNTHRSHVYTVDVPIVCKDIMKCIKRKNNSISFRILFRLCFGTIKIFAEQVQHLYNVTLNFVCFNTFFLKQYSRKRASARVVNNENKKRRVGSIDSLDITNLLMESEVFNEYSEERFEFPQEINGKREKKQTTSTCIHIKEITIRQISWDCPQPDEEDAFGEASQDEKNLLLSAMSAREEDLMSDKSSICQKRKSPIDVTTNLSPTKKQCFEGILENSIEEVRCAPESVNDENLSEFNINYRSQSVAENQMMTSDVNEKEMTLDERYPSQQMMLEECEPQNDPLSESLNVLNAQQNEVNTSVQDFPTSVRNVKNQAKKRPKSHLIIDRSIKLPKIDLDYCKKNIWENCFNYDKKEHIVDTCNNISFFNLNQGPTRFPKLLGIFKNFKRGQKQTADRNRQLLVEEILEDKYETYKSEFKLTTPKGSRSSAVDASNRFQVRHEIEETSILPVIDENIDVNNNCKEFDECPGGITIPRNSVTLECSLDEINLNRIQFDFPNDADTQSSKSKWGKEGILKKLLSLWKTRGAHVSMTTLIIGASRINAALTFHTLLDLAGQQYVEIIKDDNNSIKFINMGPEMIRKINKLCT